MNSSKQKKVDLLNKIKSGEMKIEDLLKQEGISMEAMFFSAKRRDISMEERIKHFEQKYPGRPYTVFKIVRRGDLT